MKHLYKVNIPKSTLDLFFTALDTNKNLLTFMAVSKEGKVLTDLNDGKRTRTVEFELREGSIVALDGSFVIPIIHLQKMNEYFNL